MPDETPKEEPKPHPRSAMRDRVFEPPPPSEPVLGLTPQQLALRKTGIGGSEIGVLCGLSRWSTPIAVWESKVLDARKEPTLPMDLGNMLEEPCATLYRRKTGRYTGRVATLRHPDPEFSFALCTPDRGVYVRPPPAGEVLDQGDAPLLSLAQLRDAEKLFQAKSTTWRQRREWGPEDSDEVPPEYLVAEVWGMGITGLRTSDFGVLFDKDDFKTYTVHFQQELFEDLYAVAERFMVEHVLPGIPPEPDASNSYADFVKRMWPREEGDREALGSDPPPGLEDFVRTYARLRGAQDVLKTAVELYRTRIATLIGEKPGFFLPFGKVTWLKDADTMGVRWDKACAEARQLAQLLLMNFGELLPAEQRDKMAADLRGLETKYACVSKRGPRKVRVTLEKDFKASLPDARVLRLSLGDAGLPAGAESFDVGQMIDGVATRADED